MHEELFVDTSTGNDRVKINFDVTFPSLACPCENFFRVQQLKAFCTVLVKLSVISVDAMDVSGEHQSDVSHNVWKERLDKTGHKIKDSEQKQGTGTSIGYWLHKVYQSVFYFQK